uniref:Protein kinase, putative n=1 Tax=Trypanosoma vivax (strain Y486) TaxID=1055687 RepID=G0U4G9_TRYVY
MAQKRTEEGSPNIRCGGIEIELPGIQPIGIDNSDCVDGLNTPPYRRRLVDTSESEHNDDYDDCSVLNSSTSTAGPPGQTRTGRYHYRQVEASLTGRLSSTVLPSRACRRSATAKRAGSYRTTLPGKRHSNNGRSLSNASTVASLIGSVQEWGRSFCVFSPARGATPSRQSIFFGQKMPFGGTNVSLVGGASSPPYMSPSPGASSPRLDRRGQSIVFSQTFCPQMGNSSVMEGHGLNASVIFHSGQLSSSYMATSPTLSSHWCRRQSTATPVSTPPKTAAYSALGGSPRITVRQPPEHLSPAQKELPKLLRSLCCHLALTGTPIIIGDSNYLIDARKGPLIGVGGFAKVYAGVDCVTGNLIAIKEINLAEVNDKEAFHAISKEFGVLKSLRHPNIVSYTLFEHSVSQKVCRIMMELLTGGSTLSLLERFGPLRESILRKFGRHLLEAIAFIHKEGFSHRDIKPANILVSHDGVVKLCDFGCCKRINELNKQANCVIGTPLYMAPELIKGEGNHKSDIWSMGCSLFELATGKLPWYHTGVRDNLPLMFYITTTSETPLVPPAHGEGIEFSAEFVDFLNQCFTRSVASRPEARDLLRHPWIVGDRGNQNQITAAYSTMEEELLCQQELEDVSATISIETCAMWMTSDSSAFPPSPFVESQRGESRHKSEDLAAQVNDKRLVDSQTLLTTSNGGSSAMSSRGATGGCVPISPAASLDMALHESFNYTMPQGSMAGRFIFPSCSPQSMSIAMPQYLRITEEGNLDFAAADEDLVESGADLDDTFAFTSRTRHNCTPSYHFPVGVSLPGVAGGSAANTNVPLPPHQTSLNHHGSVFGTGNTINNVSTAPASRSPASRNPRLVSISHNPSISMMSSSIVSRVVSPSRYSQRGSTTSPPITQSVHSPSVVGRDSNCFTPPHSIVSRLPDNVKRDTNGRLRMSISVPTGGSERCVDIPLSIDPEDVQCKIIDRAQSLVVTFSDDIRTQLAAKMSELSSSLANSRTDGPGDMAGSPTFRAHNSSANRSSRQYKKSSIEAHERTPSCPRWSANTINCSSSGSCASTTRSLTGS